MRPDLRPAPGAPGFLPQGRASLYEAALSMLLERRDLEREVYGRGRVPRLDQKSATEPLQRLAYWLIRNERTQLDLRDAVDVVRRLQPSVPSLAEIGTAEEALQLLLERSGLLREPAPGAVNFIHRTFQDFLGAKAVLEERDIGMLVNNAHLEEWEDVVQMAVAQARHQERADLLTRLRERGDREKDAAVRARLRLLAFASLEQATRLEPSVREAIEDRAARMLPPRSLREARSLAQSGPLLLGLLPGTEELAGDEELATVHAICQIGGDAAIPGSGSSCAPSSPPYGPNSSATGTGSTPRCTPRRSCGPCWRAPRRGRHGALARRTGRPEHHVRVPARRPARRLRPRGDPRRARPAVAARAAAARRPGAGGPLLLSAYPQLDTLVLQGCRNVRTPRR
ncbi:hypothetical protein NKH77_42060 [Streptomyces sp. M19]